MVSLLPFLAGVAVAADTHRLVFESISAEAPAAAPYGVSSRAWVDGREVPVRFQELLRVGDQPGDSPVPFGQLRDQAGAPFGVGHAPFTDLCNQLDYTAIQQAHGKLWLWSHFECVRGAMFLTELSQDPTTGELRAVRTQPVDDALHDQGGLYSPCAGDVTPWGTLLSSEEYEPDARYWDAATHQMTDGYWFTRSHAHLSTAFASPAGAHPYRFGWTPEFRVTDPSGAVDATKHYAMGRFSHEISRVLPDQRTVLQSDDGWGVGLFLFVADTATDLSAGHLYAAQWTVTDDRLGGSGSLTWVPLGHATDADIHPLVERPEPVRFDELFDRAERLPSGRCPATHTPVRAFEITECLRLAPPSARVPDPATAASRLETRRYAGLLGATLEWRKGEGLASDPTGSTVYFSVSDVRQAMLPKSRRVEERGYTPSTDDPTRDPAPDTVRLTANHCGVIYEGRTGAGVRDSRGQAIDSAHVPLELHAAVRGVPDGSGCAPTGISNPDNVTYLGGYDLLAIAEDTRRSPDGLWVWDRHLDTLSRVLLAPAEAEIAGLGWLPDLGGHAYLTLSLQGPGSDTRDAAPFDPALAGKPYGAVEDDHRSVVGVLGPLPVP